MPKQKPLPGSKPSKAEIEVAKRVALGLSNQDVADEMFLSKRTVDFHLHNLFLRFGVKNRISLLRSMGKEGYLE